ncbi:tRNA lysidine(34) synthetase TilS [Entomomonas asaccharolytica]|uniref:tRNA(Ile)-lysidine synthase n=1 Tax=Entomomonas asaccharolytica TaxID=2785331 RepID=A0A974RX28_9GAMM|nr:tRNA lysidine(34) synthetase TilS [Entomomonas asaccharolytica]QQP85777.1 tRNA lysidine(34) synthetase TilS [Entomomonas asaccharolytica]
MSLISQLWQQLAPYQQAKRWIVGFSGGMDSTVLLHLLVQLKKHYNLPELSAIYIHHGLQAVAESWPEHCQKICDELAIPLTIIKVKVAKQASIEQVAREARYQAFEQIMQKGDILLTAQHQNDQAETLLFRLLRGAGVRGLTAIPKSRPLAAGTVVRPLLDIPYQTLKNYAETEYLKWIEDPSNADTSFARNYLRHQIIPVLQDYWPQAINNIAQTAKHLQEAQQLLNELAIQDLTAANIHPLYPWLTIPSLQLAPLANLTEARQKNALSYWLAKYTLLPATVHWQGWQDLLKAKECAKPIWQLQNGELHRSNQRIWLLMDKWLNKPTPIKLPISPKQEIPLPNNGMITLQGDLPNKPLLVSYRQGGEVLQLHNRGHRDLKRLFNEQAIPSFIRQRIPLLLDEQNTVIAVANFPQWRDKDAQQNFSFEWSLD